MFLFLCSECSRRARLPTLLCAKLVGNGSAISLDLSIPRLSDFQRAVELICTLYPGYQLKTTKPLRDRRCAGGSMPGILCVHDRCSTSASSP